jgi:hypothetical protein
MIQKYLSLLKQFLLILFISLLLLEVALRLLPYFANEPLKSFILEAHRIPITNVRIHRSFINDKKNSILIPPICEKEIAFIGDSFVFGSYVHQDSCFVSLIGNKLQKQVVNLGIAGANLKAYNNMVAVSLRYKPKKIVYCIFGGNDFAAQPTSDTTQIEDIIQKSSLKTEQADYFITEEDISWDYKVNMFGKKITNLSIAYQVAKLILFGNADSKKKLYQTYQTKDIKNNYFVLFDKKYWYQMADIDNKLVKNTFEANLFRIKKVAKFAKQNQIALHVVLFPFKEMVHGQLVPEKEMVYSKAYKDCFDIFAAALQKEGIDCYDTTPDLLQAAKSGKKLYFTIDGHFSELGNRVVSDLLIQRFKL